MGIYNINLLFPRFEDLLENPVPITPDLDPEPDPTFTITDIGSGRFSAAGTDSEVMLLDESVYQLDSPYVNVNAGANETFTAESA